MRILLDHCLPRRLKNAFPAHEVVTAAELGWDALRNGKLLTAAATRFDVFVTIDKNLKHQQNLATLPVAVIVILAPTNRFGDVVACVPSIEKALQTLMPCTLIEVSLQVP